MLKLLSFSLIVFCTFSIACADELPGDGYGNKVRVGDDIRRGDQVRTRFWYEENNGDDAGLYPDDLYVMFTQPETWEELRPYIDTYILRGNSLLNLLADPKYGEAFFRDHFIPVLNEAGISFAIDNPKDIDAIARLVDMGVNLSHVSIQSAVSKTRDEPEAVQARVDRAVEKMLEVKERFPWVKVGFGDATPTKGREYRAPYAQIARRLKEAGHSLGFVHLDAPYEAMVYPTRGFSWEKVKEAERYVQDELGADFGFICTSRVSRDHPELGLEAWHKEFFERVTSIPDLYIDDGSLPDYFILNSWYAVPQNAVPEDAGEGVYPTTKVGLHLARSVYAKFNGE